MVYWNIRSTRDVENCKLFAAGLKRKNLHFINKLDALASERTILKSNVVKTPLLF